MKVKFTAIHFSVFLCWSLLVLRCFQLQVLPNEKLEGKVKGQFVTHIKINSKRGNIYDRNGKVLATSVFVQSLFVDPSLVKNKTFVARKISKILKISQSKVLKKINKKGKFTWIKRKISEENFEKISKLNLRGVGFVGEYKRVYMNKGALSHLIGRVDIDGRGLSGLELKYNNILKGSPVKYKTLRDGRGRPLIFSNYNLLDEINGGDVYLGIDVDSQVYFSKILKERLKEVSAKRAWGVLMDPQNGEIIASTQVFSSEKRGFQKNIVTSEIHEPGSVLKTFSFVRSMTALNLKPLKKFSCGDEGFEIGRLKIRNSHKENCEKIPLIGAFAKSLNTVSSELALNLGEKKLVGLYKNLGFHEKTGVDFPGEAKSIFHKKLSGKHHLASLSFGHGVSLTPLQVVKAYGIFGNGGYLLTPHYLKKINKDGVQTLYKSGRQDSVFSRKEVFLAKGLMSSVLNDGGTATQARVKNYLVGGKTGTSQKIDLKKGGYGSEVLSSFIGLFPLASPKYVALVTFDEPQNPRSGGVVAGPVFSKLASYTLRKEKVMPDKLDAKSLRTLASLDYGKSAKKSEKVVDFKEGKVPDLRGYSLREVFEISKGLGIKFKISGSGKVSKMRPLPGTPLPSSKVLDVTLSL